MKFKHAFHVLIDNFSTTYKLLVFRLIVMLITLGLTCAVIIPTFNSISSMPEYKDLHEVLITLWNNIKSISTVDNNSLVDSLKEIIIDVQKTIDDLKTFLKMLFSNTKLILIVVLCLAFVRLISRFFVGIGSYVGGALVNDRMCLHAKSSFTGTLIKDLGKASLYGVIYAPLAFAYDMIGFTLVGLVMFKVLTFVPFLIKIFLIAVIILALYAFKFTLTCNWLPSLIQGKQNNRNSMAYSFNLRGKQSSGVFATATVLVVIILALNVAAVIFTFGAGLLITIPATDMMLLSLQFVCYFDNNKLKYFVDDYTVIGPKKEKSVSREEFFKGQD